MPQRNNPMSAVQKKRTVSTTKKKGTTSSSKTSRTSKKEQMKHRTVMPHPHLIEVKKEYQYIKSALTDPKKLTVEVKNWYDFTNLNDGKFTA